MRWTFVALGLVAAGLTGCRSPYYCQQPYPQYAQPTYAQPTVVAQPAAMAQPCIPQQPACCY